MSESVYTFVSVDLMPLIAAACAACACGVLGNFLVLRRQSMMGDAISHSVLPGLILAFLITGQRDAATMFIGAAASGLATVVLVELIKRYGKVEPGAAMGVVFCVLFALGVLLIETESVRQVDLDADCVLHGQLETLFWLPPRESGAFWSASTLAEVPRQVWTLLGVLVASAVFVGVLFKELRLAAFDPGLAVTQGIHAGALHVVYMAVVAIAVVASFEAVGSILVVAMLVCPAATARLLTDRLSVQVWLSGAAALAAAVGGYAAATGVPALFGAPSVSAAGAMAVVAGVLLVAAVLGSPSQGIVVRAVRQRRMGATIARDDVLSAVYRLAESAPGAVARAALVPVLGAARLELGLHTARGAGYAEEEGGAVRLTPAGRALAQELVRRHRLWEHYLVEEAGLAPDHVHGVAHQLEHTAVHPEPGPETDPHGREIPR